MDGHAGGHIQQLNPELRRWTTPVRGAAYTLKVPEGTADTLEKRLDETPESERVALNWHTVKSGETLLTIARKLRVSRADLAEANYLSVKARVRPGQKLIIPREPATLMAAQPDRPTPPLESRPIVERASLVSTPDTSAEPEVVRRVYRVKRGDTLVVHRAALRHERLVHQDLEPAAHQPHQRRPAPDRLHPPRQLAAVSEPTRRSLRLPAESAQRASPCLS